jgi:hypothetical protein
MLSEKDKQMYEKYAGKGLANRILYSTLKWSIEKPIRHLITNINILGEENLSQIKGACVLVPYHTLSIEEPLLGEVFDDLLGKPHALMTQKVFSRHPVLYSSIEEVPFNTNCDESFKEDYKWSLNKIGAWIKRGEPIFIFNDGETESHIRIKKERGIERILSLRDRPNSIIPAKLAFEYDVPVIPVATFSPAKYEQEFYTWDNWKSWFKVLKNLRIPYTFEFLEPMLPKQFNNPSEMKRAIRERQIVAYERQRGINTSL